MHSAAESGKFSVVQALLVFDANVNSVDNNNRKPLHLALKNGCSLATLALVKTNSNAVDKDAEMSLYLAVTGNNDRILISALVKVVADVNVANKDGVTPLLQPAQSGNNVETLIKAFADVKAVDNIGRSALSVAPQKKLGRQSGLFMHLKTLALAI